MTTAFQSDAFQNNAFQIDAVAVTTTPPRGTVGWLTPYAKGRTKEEVRREREAYGILPKVQVIIEDVAALQAQQLALDEQQRFEQFQRELALANIEFDNRYLEALNAERERLIDAEIQRRMQQLVARRNMTALLMMASVA